MTPVCSECGKTGPHCHVELYPPRARSRGNQDLLCRWCRAVRTRERRAAALRRSRSAVAQEVERPAVTREGGGSRPSRGASEESPISMAVWCVGLILFFLALGFYSCKAEAAELTCWTYETETSTAWTDNPEHIPARYRDEAREVPFGSLLDYERTTIVEAPEDEQ